MTVAIFTVYGDDEKELIDAAVAAAREKFGADVSVVAFSAADITGHPLHVQAAGGKRLAASVTVSVA